MTVSVVIPSYNSAALVVEAVRSVLAQTRPAHEVLVVDDGSTDDTAARLAEFGPPVRVFTQPNGGVSSARNRGVAAATGDVVAFLDADDVWHPEKLARQLPAFAERPDLGLLGTWTYPWPPDAAPGEADLGPGGVAAVPLAGLVVRNNLVTSTIVVKADVLRGAGEFDVTLQGPEDYDLWLRVARRAPVAVLQSRLTGYRAVAGSLSRDPAKMEAGMRAILHKLDRAGAFRGDPLLRRKAWGYFHYSVGYMHQAAGHRGAAARHAALSLLGYPLPYSREHVRYAAGRLRLLANSLRGSGAAR